MAKRSGKSKGLDPSLFGAFEIEPGLWCHCMGDEYVEQALSSKAEFEAACERERVAQSRGAREAQAWSPLVPKRRDGHHVTIKQTRTRVEEF